MKKILILTANPKNTERIRFEEEVRDIQTAVDRSKNRDQFEIITRLAVRVDDLHHILLEHEPQIVHFSGHGGGSEGLALENNLGQMQLVTSNALAGLFKLLKANVECVFLNACYSEEQANAIHPHINYVVGMNKAIGDRAAIKFAEGFYRAIGFGKTYETAFEWGLNAIDLPSIPESSTPVIKVRDDDLQSISESSIPVSIPVNEVQDDESKFVPDPIRTKRVFICYCRQDPDERELARQFFEAINATGHEAFMEEESIECGDNRKKRIDNELELSDYFLLLLSKQAAASEVVRKEVKEAVKWRNRRKPQRPTILPIWVNFSMNSLLHHGPWKYLQDIQQWEWTSTRDTDVFVQKMVNRVSTEPIGEPDGRSPRQKTEELIRQILREFEHRW